MHAFSHSFQLVYVFSRSVSPRGRSLAKIPNILHQYVNGEDEIANILQVSPRISAADLPSIECDRRIGYNDGCSANFTNISNMLPRNSQSAGQTIAIECPLCVKTGSGPVLVGVGRKDGLGQMLTSKFLFPKSQ